MTWAMAALVVLAAGVILSALSAWSRAGGLFLGLLAALVAGVLCVAGGWTVLSVTPPGGVSADWPMPLGGVRLAVDGLSAWFLLIVGLVTIPVSIYSWGYFRDAGSHARVGAFAPLLCTMIGAMVIVVSAVDVVLFLIGWELMSLSAFFLVGLDDRDAEVRQGAWTYLVATHLGTGLGVLPVFAAFVARSGGTAMGGFAGTFAAGEGLWCTAIFLLGLVGFGTKAGFMPFHVWLPAAHPVAPSPVSALMSGVVIKTGVYGLLRLLSWLPELPAGCAVALLVVSVTTGTMGILYALGQRQVKRMLAYSSIENIGVIGIAISVGLLGHSLHQPLLVALGFGGALLHALNHAVFKGLLFLSAGAVLHSSGTGDMERLGGLAAGNPVNALAFLIGSVAICALPPLNGFVGEFVVYLGILQGIITLPGSFAAALAACVAALALIGGLALAVFSKTFSVVFLGAPRDPSIHVHSTPASMNAGMFFLVAGCIVMGVGSSVLVHPVSAALRPFVDGSEQAEAFNTPLGWITRFSSAFVVLVACALGLFVLRRFLPAGARAGGTGGTWGCGYALPTRTMQYTGSSYVWKLVQSFRLVVRGTRRGPSVASCFPTRDRLVTTTTDLAQERFYKPVFRGLARLFERLWPLQHGRIQLYLVYIVATVLIVFLVEGWSTLGGDPAAAAMHPRGNESAVLPGGDGDR